MRKSKFLVLVFIAISFGFFACQKDDLSNSGPSTLGVKIMALNKSYSLPVNGTKSAEMESSTIRWDTVQMMVSTVKFEAKLKSLTTHRDSIEISYKWTGPKKADLLDSTISFGDFILQPGFYDEIEIGVQGLKEDAKPGPVFKMAGLYTNGDATTIPVRVEVFANVSIKTEKDSVEVTGDNIDVTSYIQLYLDELMANVKPAALDNARLINGIIVISAENNSDIYQLILRNLGKDHHCEHGKKYKDGKWKGHDD